MEREKPIITNKILKLLYKKLPSLKDWYDDGTTGQTLDLISPWYIPENIIEDIVNHEIDLSVKDSKRYKDYNLNGLGEYYLNFMIRLLNQDSRYYSFSRLKKILKKFCELTMIFINEKGIGNSLGDEDDYDLDECKGIKEFVKLVNLKVKDKSELLELEEIISNNLICFLQYEYMNWRYEKQTAPIYLHSLLEMYFPFSDEFIIKHKEYFLLSLLLKNKIIVGNLDIQKIVFDDILKLNLKQHLDYFSKNTAKHDFIIDEDLRDEMILKYNL